MLAFSGGGTRAAAFSYGVLEELNRTFVPGPPARRLLDEVDAITGVSGGSFTALSYALYGDRIFQEYEARFLKRDVQGHLIESVVNPVNWPALLSSGYGRSELAAEYYDEILFERATFKDIYHKPGAPSAALPGRARLRFKEGLIREDSANRPYLHLVDGGVSDNLGLRPLVEVLGILEQSAELRRVTGFDKLRRIAVIVVNARSDPPKDWSGSESPPGAIGQLLKTAGVPIDRYSYDQIELLKDMVERWGLVRERARLAVLEGRKPVGGEADLPAIEFYPIDISFEEIDDPERRSYFMNLPTSFVLPPDAIDNLRSVAGMLMRANPTYQALLRDLGAWSP